MRDEADPGAEPMANSMPGAGEVTMQLLGPDAMLAAVMADPAMSLATGLAGANPQDTDTAGSAADIKVRERTLIELQVKHTALRKVCYVLAGVSCPHADSGL